MCWSLGLNILVFVFISQRSKATNLDLRQSNAFLELRRRYNYSKQDYEPTAIDMLRKQKPMDMEDMATLMDGTSRQLQFSQSLLRTTLENIPQGISFVDESLNLVAWNQQYEKLFNYPPEMLYVGCPIEEIYRFNALKGMLMNSGDDLDNAVKKRLVMLRSGQPYRIERSLPDKSVIEIQGPPIPSGGYVTAFTDVTAYHKIMAELEVAKQELEQRVERRTKELSAANLSLLEENNIRSRIEKELKAVHASKSRFLAAASHDLLQPINAARLLVSAINRKEEDTPTEVTHVDSALASAEAAVSSLREVATLDSGKLKPNPEPVAVNAILESLVQEFTPFANQHDLTLRYHPSKCWVYTDHHLFRRIIQ